MELELLTWINEHLHGSEFINNLFKFITYLGEFGVIWLVLAGAMLFFKKTRKCAILLFIGLAVSSLLNNLILKRIFSKTRPFTESTDIADFIIRLNMELPNSSSFPSGHAVTAITCATILIMCFGKKGAWSLIPAILISLSRIFLCVHYPSDVIVGATEGVIVGCLTVVICNKAWDILLNKIIYKKQNANLEQKDESSDGNIKVKSTTRNEKLEKEDKQNKKES